MSGDSALVAEARLKTFLSISVAVFHRWKTTLRITLDVDVCFPVNTAVTVGAVLDVGALVLIVVDAALFCAVVAVGDVGLRIALLNAAMSAGYESLTDVVNWLCSTLAD